MSLYFDSLLVSCPNEGGGLFYVHKNNAFCFDSLWSTGLSLYKGKILRALQPSSLISYAKTGEMNASFGEMYAYDIHDLLVVDESLYVVSTGYNEIREYGSKGDLKRFWRFSDALDSWHINCLGLVNGEVLFSAFGDFPESRGYKGKKERAGFVQNLLTGEKIIEGLSQPHSLIDFEGSILLANSETKELMRYGFDGVLLQSRMFDGYVRGLCVVGEVIYVGLSASRNIDDSGVENATVVGIDKESWEEVGRLVLPSKEIYDIVGFAGQGDTAEFLLGFLQSVHNEYQDMVNASINKIEGLKSELENKRILYEESIRGSDKRVKDLYDRIDLLEREVDRISNSLSWRLTKPLRKWYKSFLKRALKG